MSVCVAVLCSVEFFDEEMTFDEVSEDVSVELVEEVVLEEAFFEDLFEIEDFFLAESDSIVLTEELFSGEADFAI